MTWERILCGPQLDGRPSWAVAAQADAIVTRNVRDVARGELKFPSLKVLTPEQCLEVFPCPP